MGIGLTKEKTLLAVGVLGMYVLFFFYDLPQPDPLRVSPETTFFTTPIGPDGLIDFGAALDSCQPTRARCLDRRE